MILGLFKISGHSMFPSFSPGQTLIASSLPYLFSKPKTQDIIVFRKKDKAIVKRILKISNNKFYVEGDNKDDSLDIGWIEKKDIIGRVLFKI